MKKKLNYLNEVCSPGEQYFILIGAGVSKGAPSNLPTGIDFIDCFYNFLLDNDKNSIFYHNIKMLKEHKSLRFEQLMSIIKKSSTIGIDQLLNCYKECHSYNINHQYISTLASFGHVIATTNFDSLIERAYINNGKNPKPIIYNKDFEIPYSNENIYKLHGSLEKYNWESKNWDDSIDSIKLTLEQIAIQGFGFTTSIQKRAFLAEQFKSKHLLIIGYSGYDDFDILPVLLEIQSEKKILWLNYNPKDNTIYSGEEIISYPNNFNKSGELINTLISNELRQINNCYIVQTDLKDFLQAFVRSHNIQHPLVSESKNVYNIDTNQYFNNKLTNLFKSKEDKELIKGLLFLTIDDFVSALNIYQPLYIKFKETDNQHHKSLLSYSIAHCYFRVEPPNYEKSLYFAQMSFDIDTSYKYQWIFLTIDLLAKIYKALGYIELALELYSNATFNALKISNNDFDRYQQAILLNNYSRLLYDVGKLEDAIENIKKPIMIYKEIGNFSGLINAKINASIIYMEMKEYNKAMAGLIEIENIAKNLDLNSELCAIYNEMGIVSKYLGDYIGAIKYHKMAIEYALIIKSDIELARQYYNIACCEYKLGSINKACEANLQSLEIRHQSQVGEPKWRDLAENYQLLARISYLKHDNKMTKEYYEESNKFAEKANYAKLICDNYCNLLKDAMIQNDVNNINFYIQKLEYLMKVKYQMLESWEEIKSNFDQFQLMMHNSKNNFCE